MARSLLRQTLDTLRPFLDEGIPIIGLEPSCISVFRDELPNLFPGDPDAIRLRKQALTLAEFVAHEGDAFPLPKLQRKVLVQGHCHQKAVLNFGDEELVLRRMGMEIDLPDSGCCGMAGAFGFEKEHYDISMRVGERVLLPAVREAATDTIILADGFSCREQIAQATNREALHLAQLLRMAQREGPSGAPGPYPEKRVIESQAAPSIGALIGKVAAVAGGIAAFSWLIALSRRLRAAKRRRS